MDVCRVCSPLSTGAACADVARRAVVKMVRACASVTVNFRTSQVDCLREERTEEANILREVLWR